LLEQHVGADLDGQPLARPACSSGVNCSFITTSRRRSTAQGGDIDRQWESSGFIPTGSRDDQVESGRIVPPARAPS